ncbi:MAG: TRAP transporter small permease [Brooklawnia sp.]|uniref:TRAP transporter small permease n=1 Tax=Brooklawnia sp. TaxID=2699740 RepID=UPI003C70C09B
MTSAMDKLFRGIQILIAIFLAVMIVLTFTNVVLRFVFSTGFAWSEEVARICFIYLVYLGTIDAFRDNRHLGVELLVERVGQRAQKVLYFAIQGIVIWMMALLATGSFSLARQGLNDRWVATGYPLFLISGIGVVTGVAIILLALSNIYRMLVNKEPVLGLMAPKDAPDEEFAIE